MKFFNKIIKGLFQGTDPHFQPEGTVLKNHNGQFIHSQDGSFKWKSAKGTEKINIFVNDLQGSSFDDLGITIMALTEIDGIVYSLGVDTDGKTHIGKFEITDIFEIYSEAGNNGTISPVGTTVVSKDSDKTYYFDPDEGYKVDTVTIDGVALSGDDLDLARSVNQYTFRNIISNHSIIVSYVTKTQYTISIISGTHGTTNPEGLITVYEGDDKLIGIYPSPGYAIDSCTVDGVELNSNELENVKETGAYIFSDINENHTINISFIELNSYTIEIAAGANGTVTPEGTISVLEGESFSFDYSPNVGYEVENIIFNGLPSIANPDGGSFTILSVNKNYTIIVNFKEETIEHTIEISSNMYGTTNPSGFETVNRGSSLTIYFYPDADFYVRDIQIDGTYQNLSNIDSYTFNNVTEDHTIYVIFNPIT